MGNFSRKIKRTTKQYITVCILAILVAGAAAAGITIKIIDGIKSECESKLKDCYKEMNENKRSVYITKKDVKTGEALTQECVEQKVVYATQPQETYINADDIGKVVLVDVTAGTQILKSMVTGTIVESDIRETQFNTIMISANMLENDVVDIRIAYPNGEDYTVLAKKVLKGYKGDTPNCFLWLTEEEIIRMHNAIVDAYLYTGAYLYTTKYIEPNLQKATVVNYTPTVEAINLIRKNPNILQTAINELSISVRKALENRLTDSLNKDVATEKWNLENNYIYQEKETNTNNSGQVETETSNTNKESVTVPTPVPTPIPEDINQNSNTTEYGTTEMPKTGDQESNNDINEKSGAELGNNIGVPKKEDSSGNYKTNYFAVTEG